MRKTRLVILPTKCLHQMGFLLLFLSCPVIGDWGRIRPESEDSHNAVQIDREGTCGFERDPPGGLVDFLNENGSKQCRLSENLDLNIPAKSVGDVTQTVKSDERRVDVVRVNQQINEHGSERNFRKTFQRRSVDEKRNARKILQRNARNDVRSRSVESRGLSSNRNDVRVRSLSLNRLENEPALRSIRRKNEGNSRRENERLYLTGRRSARQNELKIEQQRSFDRQENERTIRTASDRRERKTTRFARSAERERQDVRRENGRRSTQEQSMRRRKNDLTRRLTKEKTQNVRTTTESRLSLTRREQNELDSVRTERFENGRSTGQINSERREPEIRKIRSLEFEGRKSDQREKLVRITRRSDNRQEISIKRFASPFPKASERSIRERRTGSLDENMNAMKSRSRRMTTETARRNEGETSKVNLDIKKVDEENFFQGVKKWMNLKNYDNYKTGDWTINCVVGAAVYFLTTRQIKSV